MNILSQIIIILLLTTQTAEANWLGRACTLVFNKLVVDDPYQYEEIKTDSLIRIYEQHGIQGAWNKLEPRDAILMNIMGAELRWRLGKVMIQFESPKNIERIYKAIELYGEFEGLAPYSKDRRRIEDVNPSPNEA